MIQFRFNEKKTTAITVLLLKLNGGSMNYTKLLKLLYLVDREALLRWRRPLTGDNYVSMSNGPVLSRTYNLIRNQVNSDLWNHVVLTHNYYVSLKIDTDLLDELFDELSEREISLIEEIDQRYKSYNFKQMIQICHHDCPEWKAPGLSFYDDLPVEDILKALKLSAEDIKLFAEEIDDLNSIRDMFLSPLR